MPILMHEELLNSFDIVLTCYLFPNRYSKLLKLPKVLKEVKRECKKIHKMHSVKT